MFQITTIIKKNRIQAYFIVTNIMYNSTDGTMKNKIKIT